MNVKIENNVKKTKNKTENHNLKKSGQISPKSEICDVLLKVCEVQVSTFEFRVFRSFSFKGLFTLSICEHIRAPLIQQFTRRCAG